MWKDELKQDLDSNLSINNTSNLGNESPLKSLNHSRKSSTQPTVSVHSQDDLNDLN